MSQKYGYTTESSSSGLSTLAVAKYQQEHGMEANGVADADLVRTLLEGTA